jgi:anti-sigma factor RsiW
MAHSEIGVFISSAVPVDLPLERAERLAKHLVECDECARELHLHEAHREALLKALGSEADRAIPEEYQPAHAEFEASQRELRVIARCVLEGLPADTRAKLEGLGEPSPEQRAELRTLSDLHPPAFRIALAVAEASLALESLVLRFPDKVALFADGRVVRNGDEIPQSYFAGRLAERSSVNADIAHTLWRVIAEKAVAGGIGLPGLAPLKHIADHPKGVALLVI